MKNSDIRFDLQGATGFSSALTMNRVLKYSTHFEDKESTERYYDSPEISPRQDTQPFSYSELILKSPPSTKQTTI